MKNNLILKYGLLTALGSSLLLFLSAYASLNNGVGFQDYTLFVTLAGCGIVLYEIRKNAESVTFKFAFKHSFWVGVIATIISSLVYYFLIKYYNRYLLEVNQQIVFEALDQLSFAKESIEMQKDIIKQFSPSYFSFSYFIGLLFRNLIWSLCLASFFKKEKVQNANEQYY